MTSVVPALLSTTKAAPLDGAGTRLLNQVAIEGNRVLAACAQRPEALAGSDRGAKYLYRRWVLEVLLTLRAAGALGYNQIMNHVGRPAGESLAPKLLDLQRGGLVERRELGGLPRRTRYDLTAAGRRLGSGVFALTLGKTEHARSVWEGTGAPEPSAPSPKGDVTEALARFGDAAESFAAQTAASTGGPAWESRIDTARRFAQACVHKWHGEILMALALGGPLRFGDLRVAVGAGDESLSRTLRELVETFRSVSAPEPPERRYAITALGRFDLALGVPLVLLLPEPLRTAGPSSQAAPGFLT